MSLAVSGSASPTRRRLGDCLNEVVRGVGNSWARYRVLGATRAGIAPAKEPVGKNPERYKLVEPGTIFYNPMRILLGSIAMLDDGQEPGITSPDYVAFRSKDGVLHPRWLYYWLRSPDGASFVKTLARGAVRERLLFRRLAMGEIDIPPYETQERFAAAMLVVARAHVAAEAQLEAAKGLENTFFRKAFCGITPLSASGVKAPAPSGWAWKRLGDVARLESGHTPSRYHPEWWGGEVFWISLPDIRALDGQVAMETQERTNAGGIAHSAARVLPTGTVVLSRTASVGFVTILGREMATSQDFVNWVCGPSIHPRFLMHLLRASSKYVRSLASGAIHKTVYMPTVRSFEVCVPAPEEQGRIVEDLDSKIASNVELVAQVRAEMAALSALPAALLRRESRGGSR